MDNYFNEPLVQRMIIDRDRDSGRVTRLETQAHDTPEIVGQLLQLVTAEGPWHGVAPPPNVPNTAPAGFAGLPLAHAPRPSRWLSEVIEQWLGVVARKGRLDANTITYTYAPALKVFRELIATSKQGSDFDKTSKWDVRIGEITAEAIDQYVLTFWSFPDRRGKRKHADSKEILANGGEAQSRNNALKNFGYVRMFVGWAAKCQEMDGLIRDRLEAALEDASPDERGRQDLQDLSPEEDPNEGGGYVSFTRKELKRLFEGDTFIAYAAGKASRYWIALLGLLAGLRIGEAAQLRPRDFKEIAGIWCVVVAASKLDVRGQRVNSGSQRTKTFAGRRTLPLHPMLIQLGLLEFVEERTKSKASWLFNLPWYPKPGFGHYPTRDFPKLSKAVGVHQPKRKVHHSFRSTLAQALEEVGLQDTLIDRFLGHKVRTVRAKHYGRNSTGTTVPVQVVFDALSKVDFELRIPPWSEVVAAVPEHLGGLFDMRRT